MLHLMPISTTEDERARNTTVAVLPIGSFEQHGPYLPLTSRTLHAVITDIQQSLRQSGISKLVLINGHGGNYVLRNIVQEATVDGPVMALFPASADWVRAREAAEMATTDHEDMHAGELETSILMHACPKLVRDGYQNSDHTADDRSALLTLGMEGYTTSGIIGRPSLASAAKGKSVIASLVESFARCLAIL